MMTSSHATHPYSYQTNFLSLNHKDVSEANLDPLLNYTKTKPPLLVRLSHNRALVPTSTHLSVCPAVDSNQAELVLRRRGAPEAIYFTRCTYAHTYAQILEGNVNILQNYNLFEL